MNSPITLVAIAALVVSVGAAAQNGEVADFPDTRSAAVAANPQSRGYDTVAVVAAASGPVAKSIQQKELWTVTLDDAKRIIAVAEKKAAEIGQPMNIAVTDAGGNLVAHVRMDGAWIGSIDISIKKAFTARAFDIATKDLAEQSQSGGQFFGIHASNEGRVMIFAGGIPLKRDGKVVGAIGVSGGSGQQDQSVALAGATAFR